MNFDGKSRLYFQLFNHTKTLIPALERGYPPGLIVGTLQGRKHLIKTPNDSVRGAKTAICCMFGSNSSTHLIEFGAK